MSDPTFWDNPDKAREISQEATQLKNSVEGYKQLVSDIEDASVMLDMAIEEEDTSMEGEIKQFVNGIQEAVEKQEVLLLLGGEYDQNNAILTFHAGAGGTEAQDWCSMKRLGFPWNLWMNNLAMKRESKVQHFLLKAKMPLAI